MKDKKNIAGNELTWQEQRLLNLKNLPIEPNFKIPEGLYIPFLDNVLIREVKQGEMKTKTGISGASQTIGASIGVIYAIGEGVTLPVSLGMRVYYEPTTKLRVIFEGEEFIQIGQYYVFGAVPPDNYLETKGALTVNEKRRESRKSGLANANKRDDENILIENDKDAMKKKGSKIFLINK